MFVSFTREHLRITNLKKITNLLNLVTTTVSNMDDLIKKKIIKYTFNFKLILYPCYIRL